MRVKIQGGTVPDGEPSLCYTCRHATIIKGATQSQEIIECGRLADGHGRVTFRVASCTSYSDRRRPSLYDMEDIAWVLRSDPKHNTVGFVRSREQRIRQRLVVDDE